jgi:hypothetical protein
MRALPEATMRAIQHHFHKVILARSAALVQLHALQLPDLAPLLTQDERKGWFDIPGMYGGFSYWLESDGVEPKLIVESWSRVAEGSGQRHEVTAHGSKLIEQGFV